MRQWATRWLTAPVSVAVALVLGFGCSADNLEPVEADEECVPERAISCQCPSGAPGIKVCDDTHTFGDCQCPEQDAGLADDVDQGTNAGSNDAGGSEPNDSGGDTDVGQPDPEYDDLVLPIEVMHGDVFGEYEENEALDYHGGDSPRYVVEVDVEVDDGGGALWVWGHHVGFQYFGDWFEWDGGEGNFHLPVSSSYDAPYDGRPKAAVRINDGDWIELTNDNVTCATTEQQQGCIGGVSSATRFRVDDTDLESGPNTIEFAYLGHELLSSGYRILDLAVLPDDYMGPLEHREIRAVDRLLSPRTEVLDVDTPEGGDPADGGELWHDAALIEFPGGDEISATCNDCHAQDGRDMQYFNYSNESLVVRSEFHGLSEQQGRDIAAYIRAQPLETPDGYSYDPPGTPWDPPYQPGPRGFGPDDEHPDVAHAQHWSAGAGLEWVADDEHEVLHYVFPDGTADHDAGPFEEIGDIEFDREIIDHDGPMLNMREIPLSIQMPDWNRWLPIIHPKDAFGEEYFYNSRAYEEYEAARDEIPVDRADGDLSDVRRATFRHAWRSNDGFVWGPIVDYGTAWNRYNGRVNRGSQQWRAIKQWELHHEFDLEGWFHQQDDRFEKRTWGNRGRIVFDIASHIAGGGTDDHQGQAILDGPPYHSGVWLSHVWYHLQVVINPGTGDDRASGQNPVDWNYQFAFARGHDGTGLASFTRWMTTWIKMNEFLINTHGLSDEDRFNGGPGFNSHRHGLYEIYRFHDSDQLAKAMTDDDAEAFLDTTLASWGRTVQMWDVDDFLRNPWEDPETGELKDHRNRWGRPDDSPYATNPTSHGMNNAARNHYNSLRLLDNAYELAPETVDALASWGSQMWADPEEGSPPWETWIIED